jgi:hypothetical protein
MIRSVVIALGAIWAVGLIVVALWGWQQADVVVSMVGWEKRTVGAWSVRCGAAALVAMAELVALTLVVGRVYRRPDAFCGVAKFSALVVGLVCTVSAVALGLAGR